MTMKNDAKFGEELTCWFKIDVKNLTNFDPSTKNSQNLHVSGLLLTKLHNFWTKESTEELYLTALKIDAKFEGKLACAFKNDMKNLANFRSQAEK